MLVDDLKVLQASSAVYSLKASGFHWNVEGPNFPQYHDFLGELYDDVYSTIDKIAEYIRALDCYAPASLSRYLELTKIPDQLKVPRAELMFVELYHDTQTLIDIIMIAFESATQENQQGIANFLSERQEIMQKHMWMIKSTLKKQRS